MIKISIFFVSLQPKNNHLTLTEMKRTLFLTTIMLLVTSLSALAQEAYAVYNASNTTLTFYYDNMKDSRSGTVYDIGDGTVKPGWYETDESEAVTQVVISPAFRQVQLKGGSYLFAGLQKLEKIVGMKYLDTSEMTTMDSMFSGCWELKELDLSHFDTRNVRTMRWMFGWATSLESLDLTSFDTRNVANMSHMFYECMDMQTVDLSSFNTSNVADFTSMFDIPQHSDLTTIYASEEFVTASATTYGKEDMFVACTSLVGGSGSHFDETCTSADYARIDGGLSDPGYLTYKAPKLWVKGIQVTRDNKSNILGDGKVKYDVGTKTLTLTNANITSGADNIRSEVPGLTIQFEGTSNTLSSNSANIKSTNSDITLTGSGEVSMESDVECMSVTGEYTRIDGGLSLTANAGNDGYFAIGSESTPAVLTIAGVRTRVEAFSPNEVLQGFLSVNLLDGQQFTKPADVTYDYNEGLLDRNGNLIKNQSVVIAVPLVYTNLWIGGTEVTNHNCDDILGDGSAIYDEASKTLTLNGINLDLNGTCIQNGTPWNSGAGIDGLTIQVKGNCSLRSTEQALFVYDSHTTITGDGKLTLKSDNEAGVTLQFNSYLTLLDANVEVEGYDCAINSVYTNFMDVNHSRLMASSTHSALSTIVDLEEFNLIDSHYNDVWDDGYQFAAEGFFYVEGYGICWDESEAWQKYYGTVSISPDVLSGDVYDLKIAGIQVTGANCEDILGDGGVFSYDPENKQLHIKGNYTASSSQTIINSSIEGLTISADQDSKLTVNSTLLYDDVYISSGDCMVLAANTTITGPGKLTLIDKGDMGIYLPNNTTLTINDANLVIDAGFGIYSLTAKGASLHFVNSTVNLTSGDGGVIRRMKEVTLTDCHYINLGYHHTSVDGDLCGSNGLLTSLQIIPNTPAQLWVAGEQVQYNDGSVSMLGGAITYSYDAKQLQINQDVDVSTMDGIQALVYSELDDLDIVISKDATLTTGDVPAFWLRGNTTMRSWENSKATLLSNDCGIRVDNGKKLTIGNAYLDINAKNGIVGTSEGNNREKLEIRQSEINIVSTEKGVDDFKGSLTLRLCYIILPTDGKSYDGGIVDKDGNIAKRVYISRSKSGSATAIDAPVTDFDATSQQPLYNLNGQRVASNTSALQKGVYIINGQKVLVK